MTSTDEEEEENRKDQLKEEGQDEEESEEEEEEENDESDEEEENEDAADNLRAVTPRTATAHPSYYSYPPHMRPLPHYNYPMYPYYPYPQQQPYPTANAMTSPPATSGESSLSDHNFNTASSEDSNNKFRRNRGGVMEPFPQKLHRVLQQCQAEGLSDVISFFPHGRAFCIHNQGRFIDEVMPRYFKQSKFSSFQRQLNLYGFRRISQGPDNGGYYHENFLQGCPELAQSMERIKIKSKHPKREQEKDTVADPCFYNYPPLTSSLTTPSPPPGMMMMMYPPYANPHPHVHSSPYGYGAGWPTTTVHYEAS